ncbi:MAG: DNA-binding protein [Arcobacteraceae bacterium]
MTTKQTNGSNLGQKQRVADVVKNYSVSKSTVWKLIQDGKLKKITRPSPRITLLDTEELEEYFNSNYDVVGA